MCCYTIILSGKYNILLISGILVTFMVPRSDHFMKGTVAKQRQWWERPVYAP
jgi:hypothetical protein